MPGPINVPKSSLRNNIMIAAFLTIILMGVSITAMSQHILRRTLVDSGLSAQEIQAIGQQFTRMLTGFTLAGTAAAVLMAALLSRTITAPIRRLTASVTRISDGRLDTHIDVSSEDEFGRLAGAFNEMTQKLKESHEHLEAMVAQRTSELTQANERLEAEIVEREVVEAALRHSETRLRAILDSTGAGLFVIDAQTHTILDANPMAVGLIGLPKSEIIGKVCHQFVCPAECGKCPITDLGQTVDKSQRLLLRSDGTSMPIQKSVVHETLQGRECLIETFVDIGARTRAEDELKESLSLLQATLESTADGILALDETGQYKNFNSQYKELWRLPDEVLDVRDRDAILALALEQLCDPKLFLTEVLALREQPNRQSQGVLLRKDGTVVEYCSKPQYMNDEIVGRVWSFRDITAKYHAHQAQENLLHQVEQINEELTHFAYVVSHDLKAPLRGIKLLTEWLCTDYSDRLGDEAKENLDLLQNRVGRMHDLIEGVLQYSRVGRIKEDAERVDLNEALGDIIDAIAPPDQIEVTIDGTLPTIEGEPTRIDQVFQNLISNAVKYMDKPDGRIVVACADEGNQWKFSVRDNGPGIDEKHFDKIFKIFQTLAPRDAYESTGVGLTLVKKIVELYGGTIWVESEVGQGSTFFFTWPRSNVTSAALPETGPNGDPARQARPGQVSETAKTTPDKMVTT